MFTRVLHGSSRPPREFSPYDEHVASQLERIKRMCDLELRHHHILKNVDSVCEKMNLHEVCQVDVKPDR